ncbi:MAG TPA: 2OG-Fe(II) oxygenase [Methylophilaceae bacterium]|nr:2OG-Fe(II) oxygenase [Methylophilaceae bacterium]
MTTQPDPKKLELLLQSLEQDGFAVIPEFLPVTEIASLAEEAKRLQALGVMRQAGTGQAAIIAHNSAESIRGDFTHWLENSGNTSPIQQKFLQAMETIRSALNQHFFFGLFDLETHFAIYPPGAAYSKHLDQFHESTHHIKQNQQRQVSCILYLNDSWLPTDGGQLRLYLDGIAEVPYRDIEATGGTLVVFLSSRFWHEVMPAQRKRMSISGWFRTRAESPA